MAAIVNRSEIATRLAQGDGTLIPVLTTANGAGTAPAALSGGLQPMVNWNGIGNTFYTTLQGLTLPTGTGSMRAVFGANGGGGAANGLSFGWLYKLGTLVVHATGNQFTHDAATFPVIRTRFGAASQPVPLVPILIQEVATQTTAPILRIRNATGPAVGYTNQDGTTVIGVKDFTYPAANTAINSTFVLRLNDGDSAIRDISHIDVTTASGGSGKNASVWGFECVAPASTVMSGGAVTDELFGGLHAGEIRPAAATSGTAVAHFVALYWSRTTESIVLLGGVGNA